MKSYGIPVEDWVPEDLPFPADYSPGKADTSATTPRSFEQLDMDYDSMDSATKGDPMLSTAGLKVSPASSTSSRASSIESVEEEDTHRPHLSSGRWKGSYERRRQTAGRPATESFSPRIPVVSRPYLSRCKAEPAALVFPLPAALSALGDAWPGTKRPASWREEAEEAAVGVIRAGPGLAVNDMEEFSGPPKKVILQGRR